MLSLLKKFFGTKSNRDLKELTPLVEEIKATYDKIKSLDNDQLRAKTLEFKSFIAKAIEEQENRIAALKLEMDQNYDLEVSQREVIYTEIDSLKKVVTEKIEEALMEILPEAFSVVKETARRFKENEWVEVTANDRDRDLAAKRDNIVIDGNKAKYRNSWMAGGNLIQWDMMHYDVQLIGGVVLHQGKIAEMATGEGKTLVATLPVYLNALPGKGVHVVTVNDYLSKRDSEWMGMLFEFHGMRVDCIDKHEPNSDARRNAYLADVTYGTNNEFGFDYLRDNMTGNPSELVQREHNYAIVDEVDSVLIDDARTPLIISGPTPKAEDQLFAEMKPAVERMYDLQRKLVTKILADAKVLLQNAKNDDERKQAGEMVFRAHRGLPKNKALIKLLSEEGIGVLMQKTENFYLLEQGKNMHIIDDELYFVIEEKQNSVDLTEKGLDFLGAAYNDSDFFILPDVGAVIADLDNKEMKDEERINAKDELMRNYGVKAERVHTVNQLVKAYAMFERDIEYVVLDNKIKIVDEQTGRILEGRRYSDGLHQAIEAKENVKVEAATQTYATITLQNYFRMYKKLAGMTGTAETEAGEFWDIYKLDVVVIPTNRPIIRKDHDDLVYRTKREKYNAVIDRIVDLVAKGRPVLVGTTSVETSELLSRMLKLRNISHNVLNAKLHAREAEIVAFAGKAGTVTIATNMAGRGTDIKLGPGVKEAGGLAIIGTERHDSRRVDRQLRGRSGRQGDPGSSEFYVSLEDDLMRLFGSERISGIMDRLGMKEGEVIQHSTITKSIERAQRKVEENNFGTRKRLLEYDDVMNSQREVIYSRRRNALFGDKLQIDISNMMQDVCESIINEHHDGRNFDEFRLDLIKHLAVEAPFKDKEFFSGKVDALTDQLFTKIYIRYKEKCNQIASSSYPVIADVRESQSQFEYISIPLTDGLKTVSIIVNISKAIEDKGREVVLSMEKSVVLSTIDNAWKEHLREMDDLKQAVQNASYEQKDPLLIYKFESFELFSKMVGRVNNEIVSFLAKANLPGADTQIREAQAPKKMDTSKMRQERSDLLSQSNPTKESAKPSPIKAEKHVGRNDPCPCGSGKKFKNCHGKEE